MALPLPAKNQLGVGFNPEQIVVHGEVRGRHGMDQVWSWVDTFKGKQYFHIQKVYKDDTGRWMPGKGLTFDHDPTTVNQILKSIGEQTIG